MGLSPQGGSPYSLVNRKPLLPEKKRGFGSTHQSALAGCDVPIKQISRPQGADEAANAWGKTGFRPLLSTKRNTSAIKVKKIRVF
jgi:hypothetical protein